MPTAPARVSRQALRSNRSTPPADGSAGNDGERAAARGDQRCGAKQVEEQCGDGGRGLTHLRNEIAALPMDNLVADAADDGSTLPHGLFGKSEELGRAINDQPIGLNADSS